MQQTTNLNLELYEATDNANLLDGYNSSMRKIDTHAGTQDGLITLAQSTANSAASAAATADGKAVDAASAAAVADGKAMTAQTTIDQFKAQPYSKSTTTYTGTLTSGLTYSVVVDRYVIGTTGLQVCIARGITSNVSLNQEQSIYVATVFEKNVKEWPVQFSAVPAVFVTSDLTSTWGAIVNDTEGDTDGELHNRTYIPGLRVLFNRQFQSNHDAPWSIMAIGPYATA